MQPTTRYAKSGDVHVAYQVFGEGLTLSLRRALSPTLKTVGMSRVWRAG